MRVINPGARHGDMPDVTADQHHAQAHAATHLLAGNDALGNAFRQETRNNLVSDTIVNNSTTIVSVANLSPVLGGGNRHGFEYHLRWTSTNGADGVRIRITLTGGGSINALVAMLSEAGFLNSALYDTQGVDLVYATAATSFQLHIFGHCTPTGSGITLGFAQGTAAVQDLTLKASSYGLFYRF